MRGNQWALKIGMNHYKFTRAYHMAFIVSEVKKSFIRKFKSTVKLFTFTSKYLQTIVAIISQLSPTAIFGSLPNSHYISHKITGSKGSTFNVTTENNYV